MRNDLVSACVKMVEYSQVELSSQWRLRYCGPGGKHLRRGLAAGIIRGTNGVVVSFVNRSLVNLIALAISQRAAGSWYK